MIPPEKKAEEEGGGYKMKIKFLEKSKEEIKFEINNINPAFENDLRIIMLM